MRPSDLVLNKEYHHRQLPTHQPKVVGYLGGVSHSGGEWEKPGARTSIYPGADDDATVRVKNVETGQEMVVLASELTEMQ